MPEPPRRKRFQIHLSTAIVMMFVAGALIWANTRNQVDDANFKEFVVGWPNHAVIKIVQNENAGIYYRNIIIDLWIAFTILYFSYRFCEWLIRRRAARKGA